MNQKEWLTNKINVFGRQMVIEQDNKELREETKTKWYIILPSSPFYVIWQMIIILLLVFFATYVPFEVAFIGVAKGGIESDKPDSTVRKIIDYTIDLIFATDIVFNFFTAYELPNLKMEKRTRKIAIMYLSSWFFIDVTATFPIQLFFLGGGEKKHQKKGKL